MTEESTPTTPSSSGNRYVLIAVLAFVALVTVLLLKKNMEPPKGQAPPPDMAGEQMPGGEAGMPDPEAARQQAMDQIDHIKEILARDSSSFEAWSALGNLYFDAKMPEEAIIHYEAALKINPDDAHVLTDLATMKRESGKPEEAVELLKHVVQVDSMIEQAWFNMGVIYSFDLKDQKSAMEAWKKFLALNPDSPHTDAVKAEIERIEKEL